MLGPDDRYVAVMDWPTVTVDVRIAASTQRV